MAAADPAQRPADPVRAHAVRGCGRGGEPSGRAAAARGRGHRHSLAQSRGPAGSGGGLWVPPPALPLACDRRVRFLMAALPARIARWTVRIVVGCGLLLVVAALLLWWWAGQEGSLQWVLGRLGGRAPVRSDGVEGSVRGVWHIARVVWERDGLRLEAEDIRLRWEPLALLDGTLQLQQVQVARARLIDTRARNDEPLTEPAQLRLPWRVDVQSLEVASLAYQGRVVVEGGNLDAHYRYDGLQHQLGLDRVRIAGGDYRGDASLLAAAPLTLQANVAGRVLAPVPGSAERVPLQVEVHATGPLRALDAQGRLRVAGGAASSQAAPSATATA